MSYLLAHHNLIPVSFPSLSSNTSDSTARSVESSGVRQPAKSKIRRHNNRLTTVFNRSPILRDGRQSQEDSRTLAGDDPAELSTQKSLPGILKIFGSDICQGTNYKSVLATSHSSAKELVKEALERWGMCPRGLLIHYMRRHRGIETYKYRVKRVKNVFLFSQVLLGKGRPEFVCSLWRDWSNWIGQRVEDWVLSGCRRPWEAAHAAVTMETQGRILQAFRDSEKIKCGGAKCQKYRHHHCRYCPFVWTHALRCFHNLSFRTI